MEVHWPLPPRCSDDPRSSEDEGALPTLRPTRNLTDGMDRPPGDPPLQLRAVTHRQGSSTDVEHHETRPHAPTHTHWRCTMPPVPAPASALARAAGRWAARQPDRARPRAVGQRQGTPSPPPRPLPRPSSAEPRGAGERIGTGGRSVRTQPAVGESPNATPGTLLSDPFCTSLPRTSHTAASPSSAPSPTARCAWAVRARRAAAAPLVWLPADASARGAMSRARSSGTRRGAGIGPRNAQGSRTHTRARSRARARDVLGGRAARAARGGVSGAHARASGGSGVGHGTVTA
jgi:hypothetical protein